MSFDQVHNFFCRYLITWFASYCMNIDINYKFFVLNRKQKENKKKTILQLQESSLFQIVTAII